MNREEKQVAKQNIKLELQNLLYDQEGLVKDKIDEVERLLNEYSDLTTITRPIIRMIQGRVQEECVRLMDHLNFLLITLATGFGKSKIAIDKAKEIYAGNKNCKILIVVPTERLRDVTWKKEFKKWKATRAYNKCVQTVCYASLSKINQEEFDLVILDEVHNVTEANSVFFSNNTIHTMLAMTATLPHKFSEKIRILRGLGLHHGYSIGLNDAERIGVVAPFDITIIECTLDGEDKYITAGSKDKPFQQHEVGNYNWLSKCVDRSTGNMWAAINRAKFIYNLRTKLNASDKILSLIPDDVRTLIFAGSIDHANKLCPNRFHSKTDSKHLEQFSEGGINRMSCVQALNEGHNIEAGIDCGLIAQLNSKSLDFIQRIGRLVRYRKNHIAHIIILLVKDTVDEKWANNCLDGFEHKIVKRVKIEDLTKEDFIW